ncbi:MAG: tetratricopeptide repeat protein [Smithellaceae bacterium]|nr:tetratricopeptide repeat protein [Smithellaceae bacterium]
MSYINDALRKARRENKDDDWPLIDVFSTAKTETARSSRRLWAAGILAVLLLVTAAIALLYWPREKQSRPDQPKPAVTAVLPSAEKKAVAAPESVMLEEMLRETSETRPDARPEAQESTVDSNEIDVRYAQALKRQNEGQLDQAEALYRKVLEMDPDHLASLNNLGVIFMQQNRYGEAIASFNDALDRKGDYVDAYYNLACLYARKNDTKNSMYFLKKAIGFNPEAGQWAIRDSDLKTLVNLPEFKKLVQVPKR